MDVFGFDIETHLLWASAVGLGLTAFILGRARGRQVALRATASPSGATSEPEVPSSGLPRVEYEEDHSIDPTRVGQGPAAEACLEAPALPILYDNDAAIDEPTHAGALIVTSAHAQTDRGRCRKRNEDSVLAKDDQGLYVVADGMGGYAGGALASHLAVETIATAFARESFAGSPHGNIPRRASELARAIQMANVRIRAAAHEDPALEGMGTTVCAARFSPNKQRLYVGHVGDSRVYRLRRGRLKQMTADHTMRDYGVGGPAAAYLSRAIGVWPIVPIDVVIAKPQPGDIYLLCSDGLTKMVSNDAISEVLTSAPATIAAERLVSEANAHGGQDNISVIVVEVRSPGLAA